MLPCECLEVQDVGPVYTAKQYGPRDAAGDVGPPEDSGHERLPLFDAVLNLQSGGVFAEAEVRSMAGNGLVVPVIGAALLSVLSCTVAAW
eukprot:13134686-Alexandrium_andersonii.AAC.1